MAALRETLTARLQERGWDDAAAGEAVAVYAYLDDLVVRCPPELAAGVAPAAQEALATLGGWVHGGKTQAWSLSSPRPSDFPEAQWRTEGLLLLGTPHGEGPSRGEEAPLPLGGSAVARHLEKALADYEAFLRGLEEVAAYAPPGAARLQTAWLLLRVCGLGKATHLLRTLPPALTQDFADALDTATLEAVERLALLDCLTEDQVAQLRLAARNGGCGLRSHAATRGPAYLGSWLGALPAVRERCPAGTASRAEVTSGDADFATALRGALDELAGRGLFLDDDGEVTTDPERPRWGWEDGCDALLHRQRELAHALEKQDRQALLDRSPREDRARLRSCGGAGAGAWLLATPSCATTSFEDGDFAAALRLRLGQALSLPGSLCYNLHSSGGRAGERCKGALDGHGVHALTCKLGGQLYRRHNQLRDLLRGFLQQAGYHCETEQWEPRWDRPARGRHGEQLYEQDAAGAFRRDELGNRIPRLERARLDLRWEAPPEEPRGYGDVVVSLPTAPSYESKAAAADGATAEEHARLKHRRYPPDAVRPGRLFAFSV